MDDPMLVPSFIPPLRGRLRMQYFKSFGILEDMIGWFGGIRFHHMDLMRVSIWGAASCSFCWMPVRKHWKPYGFVHPILMVREFLWKECWVYMNKNSSAEPFDLSWNKSLQALEFTRIGYVLLRLH